jgi:hypothetical protein
MRTQGTGKVYGHRAYKIAEGIISQIKDWHRQAVEFGQTSEWISDRIQKYVYETDGYKRLSDKESNVIFAVRNHLFREWQRKHIWTHVINGVRVATGHPSIEGNYDQLNVPMEQSLSYHCQGYLIPSEGNRIVWVPVNQKDVDSELASGRLTTDHLDMIRSSAANNKTPRLSMEYNNQLMATVRIEELTVQPWQTPPF